MTDPVVLSVVIEDETLAVTAPTTPAVNVSTISEPFTVITLEGPPGPQGPPGHDGTGARILGETPTGVVDGTNTVFTVADNYQAGTTGVYLNGLRGRLGYDYNETGSAEITFTTAPEVGDSVVVDYYLQ